ncbi:MAG: transposase [Fimbriimonadaceae bacterium]|nr:transposase [Fimbriimonadaceae bacterium]
MVVAAVTFFNAADKILRWFETRISNGFLEGLHSVLQAAKNKARGYSNPQNLIAMSYLLHGKLRPATHTK